MGNLHIVETGQENNETVIFLHAEGLAGWIWNEQVKAFPDYHCMVVDLPEHGQSSGVKPFTIARAAEMVVDLIRTRAHNGRTHLVGQSLGAQVAVQILATHPEMLDHTLLTGTLLRTSPHKETLLKLVDHIFKNYEPVKDTRFFIKAYMRTYNIPKVYFDQFQVSTQQISGDALNRVLHENLFFKIPLGLEKVRVPVLVMMGEKDYKVIKESVHDLVQVLPNSKAYMVPKTGHMWNIESPKIFNSVLRNFLTGNPFPDEIKPLNYHKTI